MLDIKTPSLSVFETLVAPLDDLIVSNPRLRSCPEITDPDWVHLGLRRVLGEAKTGRGFLQKHLHAIGRKIHPSLFFENLASVRRLSFLRHLHDSVKRLVAEARKHLDPLAQFEELNDFQVHAGDGHRHKPSTHEEEVDGVRQNPQHFFTLCLRTYALSHLCLAESGGARKGEHDTRALKRQQIETLRQGIGKGEKVLYVWDRAGLDFPQWEEWKRKAIYFLSRSKKNLNLTQKELLDVDQTDPVNRGILADGMVETSAGTVLRRVIYRCPIDSKTYSYLTNLPKKIRPGIIAMLYKMRWDIEKAFDQVKNKMGEKKAWSKSDEGKNAQAIFITLAHNLALLMGDKLEEEHDIRFERDKKRRKERLKNDLKNSKVPEEKVPSWLFVIQRVTQKPLVLWRWFQSFLYDRCPWEVAIRRYDASCALAG